MVASSRLVHHQHRYQQRVRAVLHSRWRSTGRTGFLPKEVDASNGGGIHSEEEGGQATKEEED
jgi:hypothetical protein